MYGQNKTYTVVISTNVKVLTTCVYLCGYPRNRGFLLFTPDSPSPMISAQRRTAALRMEEPQRLTLDAVACVQQAETRLV